MTETPVNTSRFCQESITITWGLLPDDVLKIKIDEGYDPMDYPRVGYAFKKEKKKNTILDWEGNQENVQGTKW